MPDDPPGLDTEHGLEVDLELLALERVVQLCVEHQLLARRYLESRVERPPAMGRRPLRLVHGGISPTQERLAVDSPSRMGESSADRHVEASAVQWERLLRYGGDAIQQSGEFGRITRAAGNDHELVTAESGDEVPSPHCLLQPRCDSAENDVACAVSQGVVDVLEAIDIDEDDRRPPRLVTRVSENRIEIAPEGHSVGESGEWVGVHLTLQRVEQPPDRQA